MHRRSLALVVVLGVAAVGSLAVALWLRAPASSGGAVATTTLRVSVLDVGQGDAILLRTPRGDDVLIDGGPNRSVLAALERHLPPADRTIELVVLTHPEIDHVGGLPAVAETYRIAQVLETTVRGTSRAATDWERAVGEEGSRVVTARAGTEVDLGGVELTVLWPETDPAADTASRNETSVVLEVRYGATSFLFTGDISSKVEERLVMTHSLSDVDVLKVPHHGSRTSSSEAFIDAATPEVAVISVGRNNSYHHPHPTTLRRYEQRKIRVFRTDLDGDVELLSDGTGVTVVHTRAAR